MAPENCAPPLTRSRQGGVASSTCEGEWTPIDPRTIDDWNRRLVETSANFRQYPYWNEPYSQVGAELHYLTYTVSRSPVFYVAMVIHRRGGVKIALVQRGPVPLEADARLSVDVLHKLAKLATSMGCAALRITHSDSDITQHALELSNSVPYDSFPFDTDGSQSLLVPQHQCDNETLAAFQPVARREIKAARLAGFEIRSSDSPEALDQVWPMLEALAARKHFKLSRRPRAGWLEMMRLAAEHNCVRLYNAVLKEHCVQTMLVVRYGDCAEYLLGAIDPSVLELKVSPSCLVHWVAMRDFHARGCKIYNLGGPGKSVLQFKRKFRPTFVKLQQPVTIVLRPRTFQLWKKFYVEPWLACQRGVRRVLPLRTLPARMAAKFGRVLNSKQVDSSTEL